MTFFALLREEPDRLDVGADFASPSSTIFSGVSAILNSGLVALFTPASVACADSTTATSSVKGFTCCSSPFERAGKAAARRSKIASALSRFDTDDQWQTQRAKPSAVVSPKRIVMAQAG